jgi:hypothetical protein
MIRMKGDHHTRTPSCFAVADLLGSRHDQLRQSVVNSGYTIR